MVIHDGHVSRDERTFPSHWSSERTSRSQPAPRVSVCVPLYNKAPYVARTIESVLGQTFADFELIVLDNASTDGSRAVVEGFDDPRLRLEVNSAMVPAPENFNRVVRLSRAPLVKVVNAYDLIHPEALERQVAVLDTEAGVVLVSCRHDLIDDDEAAVSRAGGLRTPDLVGRQDTTTVIRRVVRHGGNPLGVPGNMLFRREAFDLCGGFPDNNDFSLDVGLAVRLAEHGAFYGVPECLSSFRLPTGSASSTARRRNLRAQRMFIAVLRRRHHASIRPRDVVAGHLRWPLTWLRHHLLMSDSTSPSSWGHQLSSLLVDPRSARRRVERRAPAVAPPDARPALVTGATSGIGAAFAQELAARGRPLVLVGRDAKLLENLAASLQVDVRTVVADLAKDEGVRAVESIVLAAPGISLLVNNAATGAYRPLEEQTDDDLAELVAVNITAVLRLCRAAVRSWSEADGAGGGIINVSTQASDRVVAGLAPYVGSKAFMDGLSRCLRAEVADRDVVVTTTHPGYVATGFHERLGEDMSNVPDFEWQRPETVARTSLDAHDRGEEVVLVPARTPGMLAARAAHRARRLVGR